MAIPRTHPRLRSGYASDCRWREFRPWHWRNSLSVRFLDAGESCLVVELGDAISVALNRQVRALDLALERVRVKGVLEAVPTYRSLAVYYDPLIIGRDALRQQVRELWDSLGG